MPDSYTTHLNILKAANNGYVDTWDLVLNAILDSLDALNALGAGAVAEADPLVPSANVKVSAVSFRKSDGTIVTYAGTASQAMTLSATNYVYLTDSGVLTVSTSSFPAATFH